MRHGHPPGWSEPEPYAFASAVTRTGKSPFVPSEAIRADDGSYVVSFRVDKNLSPTSAITYATADAVTDPDTSWQEIPAELIIDKSDLSVVDVRVESIPAGTEHWFVNLLLSDEENGEVLIASGRLNSKLN
jgi:hypothetical protein